MFSIRKSNSKGLPINEEIKFAPTKIIRVVGPDSEQLGLMQYSNARKSAFDQGYDLVLIAPQADPPVCRIMDYGKFRFERDKREKEAKKKQQVSELKEIQLTCQIDTNDFNTKVNHALRFLSDGNKVRTVVKFRGRQVTHDNLGRELLDRFCEAVSELGAPDKKPKLEGRNLSVTISPVKNTAKKSDKTDKSADKADKSEPAREENPADAE
ncbi:MAG: translation initiation factor IF-3 [Eubacteriales bacterium]